MVAVTSRDGHSHGEFVDIEHGDVEASTQAGLVTSPKSAKTDFFNSKFSKTASTAIST